MKNNSKKITEEWNKFKKREHVVKEEEFPSMKRISVWWERKKKEVIEEAKRRMKRFQINSSANCLHYLGDDNLHWQEKCIWCVAHSVFLGLAIYVMWIAVAVIVSPTVTNSRPEGATIDQIRYPGIALCPINKLSKMRVTMFARELLSSGRVLATEYSEERLVKLLGFMGLAYNFEEPKGTQLDKLHNILEPYDLEDLMKRLSPQCEDLMIRCLRHNEIVNCSSIFSMHKSSEGFCCVFNYMRESDNLFQNKNTTNDLMASTGKAGGISVVMDPQLEDYLYTRIPSEGFKVLIFNPSDFPDVPSGGCLEESVVPNTEQFIVLDATLVTATKEVKKLPQKSRNCYVETDRKSLYDSYSDCVVSCRIESSRSVCGCIPFFLPSANIAEVCDLTDNTCLRKWKKSWENAWSGEDQMMGIDESEGFIGKGPPCIHCVPSCSDTSYRAWRHSIELQPESLNFDDESPRSTLKTGIFFKDHSVLHIFFNKRQFPHFDHDILLTPYEWLGSLGGLCGLVVGCSILSIAEAIYFLVFGGPEEEEPSEPEEVHENLYWKELQNC